MGVRHYSSIIVDMASDNLGIGLTVHGRLPARLLHREGFACLKDADEAGWVVDDWDRRVLAIGWLLLEAQTVLLAAIFMERRRRLLPDNSLLLELITHFLLR